MNCSPVRLCKVLALATAAWLCVPDIMAAGIPQAGPPPSVSLPAQSNWSLANGLRVSQIPYGQIPKTSIVITVGTGSLADGNHPGVAQLAADMLKQGIEGKSASELYKAAAQFGGSVGVSVGVDTLSVSIDVLSEHGPAAVALLADVLRHPTLPPSELGRLKADLKRELAVSRSQQQGLASETFAQRLYGNGPRGRRLQDTDVDAIGIDDIRQFVQRELSAGRASIYIAGKYDSAAIESAIRTAFQSWPTGEPMRDDTSIPTSERSVTLIDRPGAKQSTLLIGIPVSGLKSPGFPALSMANALLGGAGLMSRLDQNLREDKGWTYGVQSQLEPLNGRSLWILFADVNTPDTAGALQEIFSEIQRLSSTAPADDELQRVKNYRAGHFLMGASSREGLIGQVAFVDQHDLGPDWLPTYLQRLQAITPEAVRAAAVQLDPKTMTVVVAGDLSKIKSGIQGIEALQGATFQ